MRLSVAPVLVAALSCASPVRAWVCSRVVDKEGAETGPSLSWFERDLSFALHQDGTADVPGTDELSVLRSAFQVWVNVQECEPPNRYTDITFTEESELASADLVGFYFLEPASNSNLLIFRDSGWPHAARIIALTTVTYSAQTGQIIDADIEFNSEEFEFTIGDTNVVMDVLNTAVHEIGHVLGLGHPDDEGGNDLSCTEGSTMCSTASETDIDKRTLECDDRDAIVFKYPAGLSRGYCTQPACAAGHSHCGPCSAAECREWAACGFCAPPRQLTTDATVTVTGFDDGLGGCDCSAATSPLWLIVLAALRRRRTMGQIPH